MGISTAKANIDWDAHLTNLSESHLWEILWVLNQQKI
jgi:hypothetical protein